MSERRPPAVDEPLHVAEGAVAFWNAGTQAITVVWPIPYDGINEYRVYRNGTVIACTSDEKKVADDFVFTYPKHSFRHPVHMDNDHETNLYFKSSLHKLCYEDDDVQWYRNYTYQVIAIRNDENGNEMDRWVSHLMEVYTG